MFRPYLRKISIMHGVCLLQAAELVDEAVAYRPCVNVENLPSIFAQQQFCY